MNPPTHLRRRNPFAHPPLWLCALLVAALACVTMTVGEARAQEGYSPDALTMLKLVNDYRAENGLGPVALDDTLTTAARRHSEDQTKYNFFDHATVESDYYATGSGPYERATQEGYPAENAVGENIAYGYGSVERTFDGWVNSPSHNANLLNPDWQVMGLGYDPAGDMWTQEFGSGTIVATQENPARSEAPSGEAAPSRSAPSEASPGEGDTENSSTKDDKGSGGSSSGSDEAGEKDDGETTDETASSAASGEKAREGAENASKRSNKADTEQTDTKEYTGEADTEQTNGGSAPTASPVHSGPVSEKSDSGAEDNVTIVKGKAAPGGASGDAGGTEAKSKADQAMRKARATADKAKSEAKAAVDKAMKRVKEATKQATTKGEQEKKEAEEEATAAEEQANNSSRRPERSRQTRIPSDS